MSVAAIKAVNPATARQSPVQVCLALKRYFMPESDFARLIEFIINFVEAVPL
jgi:hypothetical protein